MINAEKGFAKISKEKSTKEAFSTSLSDSGLIFQAGPVLGQISVTKLKPVPTCLAGTKYSRIFLRQVNLEIQQDLGSLGQTELVRKPPAEDIMVNIER